VGKNGYRRDAQASGQLTSCRGGFFGRRKGRPLTPARARLFDTLLPKLALDLASDPQDPSSLFPSPVDAVCLEIGFGGGEYLLHQAQTHSQIGFIGVEPFENGMAKALCSIDAISLSNVRLHHGVASDVLAWLPAASLARVDLLYPDPWPKRRHWKRRFVQPESITALARVLRGGGEFRFATDIADYGAWTLRHLLHSPDFEWTAECADDWLRPWCGFAGTRYETKAKRESRVSWYLTFRKRQSWEASGVASQCAGLCPGRALPLLHLPESHDALSGGG
jgi:tRNA (guanine-N7-)-methyltransferase